MATDGKTNGRRSGGDKRLHRAGDGIEAMVEPATDLPHRHGAIHAARRAIDAGPHSPAEDAQRQGGSPTPVRRRAVVERLHRLAAGPEGAEVGVARALEILVATVAAGRRGGAGRLACTTAVAHCLEDMLLEPIGAGRMALCEGATWVLAWATRSQPAGGGERRLLERLESEAGEACERLRAGDPAAAAFVVALAGLFAASPAGRDAAAEAARALARDIARSTDDDGGPATGPAAAFVSRLLAWTSAREAGVLAGHGLPWDGATETRFQGACLAGLRLLGGRRSGVPGGNAKGAVDTAPLLALLAASPQSVVRRTAAQMAGSRKADGRKTLPRDAVDSSGTVGVLRSDWGKGAIRLLLDFGRPLHHLEIAVGDRLVVAGGWEWSVEADGTALVPSGPWSVCCFESDKNASFLEIVAPLPGGLQAERQVVLLPQDRVVILTDSVTDAGANLPSARRPDRLDYQGRLFLAAAEATAEAETREYRLAVGARHWRLLPLAFPEWRASMAPGTLEVEGGVVTLRQQGRGGRLSAPLWIDADPSRSGRPLTWRQLTVADNRVNLQRHEAVGFRVQAGLEQWLLYRALDTPRNRTVLGCNLACEFLVGRIDRQGEVSRTLEIE